MAGGSGKGGAAAAGSSWLSTARLLALTWRGRFAVVVFLGLAQAYAIRVVMSVAVIKIVAEFGYSNAQQGLILSAFYAGYMLPQLGAGWVAGRFGGWAVVLFGVLAPSLLTLLTPVAAGSAPALIALRVLTGFTEGVTYPAVQAMLAAWAPEAERATLLNVCWSGAYFGTATTFPLAGAIAGGALAVPGLGAGWRAAFFFQGALGVLWSALFVATCASSPAAHPWVSPAERALIEAGRAPDAAAAAAAAADVTAPGAPAARRAVPWRALLASRAVWACVAAHFAHNYAFYLLLSELPTFLKYQLGFDLANAGAVSVLPYLACFAGANLGGAAGDALIARGVPTLTVRRAAFAVGELLPAAALVAAGFVADARVVVALVTLSVGVSGLSQTGYACTSIDVAPHLAGVWMAFQNTFGTVPGIVAPILTAALVNVEGRDDPARWHVVFFISAAVSVSGVAVYVAGVRADVDPALAWVEGGGRGGAGGGGGEGEGEGDGKGDAGVALLRHSALTDGSHA